ncbi:ABC transporter ATP-binding protein [Nocardia rhamnosiphila]
MPTTTAPPARALDTNAAISIEHLSKRFGRTVAVDGLTVTVTSGEVFGFLGPNGAGKSTTIRMLLGLIRPTAGTARIFGEDAARVRAAHRHLAYVPADVALCAAFATRAPLLVLDEPTSGLDPLMEHQFRRCVTEARDRGQTVFLSSHQLGEVEALCDRVAILRAGRLVDIATLEELRRLQRTEVEVSYDGDPPALTEVDRVGAVEQLDDTRIRFTLSGPPTPALRALAEIQVTALSLREPTLEEIFLDYYGKGAQ